MRRSPRTVVLLLTVAGAIATGCGDDPGEGGTKGDATAANAATDAHLSLAEARSIIERGELQLVRTGAGADTVNGELSPSPVDVARLESPTSREFDLLVFATPADARRALPNAVGAASPSSSASAIRAANVVAVFPRPFGEVDTYRAVASQLRDVATACGPGAGQTAGTARVRALCFGGPGGVPPAGEGAGAGQSAPTGTAITVDGVSYEVDISRQLNPRIEPDSRLVDRMPGPDRTFFAVFLRVCNERGGKRTPTDRFALVDAFGKRVEPVALPEGNPYAWRPKPLAANECRPDSGTGLEESLVLFEVPYRFLRERPIAFAVTGSSGEARQVLLDL